MSAPMPFDPSDVQPPKEFVDLHQQLIGLPLHVPLKLLPLCDQVGQFIYMQNKLIRIAQDAVDDLLLENKYLQFDLEATQRKRSNCRNCGTNRKITEHPGCHAEFTFWELVLFFRLE